VELTYRWLIVVWLTIFDTAPPERSGPALETEVACAICKKTCKLRKCTSVQGTTLSSTAPRSASARIGARHKPECCILRKRTPVVVEGMD
jgi:hypothetical protein